jgi:hypothetical protein
LVWFGLVWFGLVWFGLCVFCRTGWRGQAFGAAVSDAQDHPAAREAAANEPVICRLNDKCWTIEGAALLLERVDKPRHCWDRASGEWMNKG